MNDQISKKKVTKIIATYSYRDQDTTRSSF